MKKKGFTLVELLVVIVILGLLMAIAIPSALNLAGKVKNKAYDTKIELIEKAAQTFGQANKGYVRQGTDLNNGTHYTCQLNIQDKKITNINRIAKNYSDSLTLGNEEYWCIKVSIADLVSSGDLDYDEKNVCGENCSDAEKGDYDNIVINPSNQDVINRCDVYIYYKYNRIYAWFDKNNCDKTQSTPVDSHGYPKKK